jgi:hypothetical protein
LEAIWVPSKLACLMLCRAIQVRAMLARGDAVKDLEILVLRHQLAVLRQLPRPELGPTDRALLQRVSLLTDPCPWKTIPTKPSFGTVWPTSRRRGRYGVASGCAIERFSPGRSLMESTARIQVFVETSEGRPLEDAEVVLRGEQERILEPGQAPGLYEASDLPAGLAELDVHERQAGLVPERRKVELSPGHNAFTVALGREGEPFLYVGEEKLFFTPEESAFLLVARGEGAANQAPDVIRSQGLDSRPLPAVLESGVESAPNQPSDVAYLEVHLPDGQPVDRAGGRIAELVAVLQRLGLGVTPALVVRRGDRPILGLTRDLLVRFEGSVTEEEVQDIAKEYGLQIQRRVLYAGNAFLFSRPGAPSYAFVDLARRLHEDPRVVYAEPQLLQQIERDQFTPNDPLWANLTHLPLINCDDAWQTLAGIDPAIRGGRAALTIAVFDPDGVAPNHPDLTATLTDGTTKLVQSFNFNGMAAQTVAALAGDHGTQCAGTATAAFNNSLGIAGVAPNCHLIGARVPSPATGIAMADAFIWAAGFNTGATTSGFPALPARAADVISNSWGVSNAPLSSAMRDCHDFLTVYGRGGRGCVVTFSIGNSGYIQFSNVRRFAAYQRTVAVGASIGANPTNPVNSSDPDPNGNTTNIATAVDRRALYSPYGPELDLVAPAHTAYAVTTNALVDPTTSTVRVGLGTLDGCPGPTVCNDYAASFGGTSHASPTVAGAAALVLSVNPALSWVEVLRFLRNSAVRIDLAQTNPIGQWVDNDGDGVAEFSQWYGFGRLDVDGAVRATRDALVASDIVVRENLADTGAVPSTGWHAHSPDIWVRRTDDPIPVLAYTADPPHQTPRRGQDNYVYCRFKNVGAAASAEVYIRAMITHYPGFEFRYPQEFVPTNRPGDPVPSPLRPGTYLIGETRIASVAAGANQIVKMTWPQALVPPATAIVNGTTVTWHPCLLLEASPHDGPMPAGATFDIRRDNNIAQRNIAILDPGDPANDAFTAIIMGSVDAGVRSLVIDRTELPGGVQVLVRLADPEQMAKLLAAIERDPGIGEHGRQVRLLTRARLSVTSGGDAMVIEATPGTSLTWLGDAAESNSRHAVSPVVHNGVEALRVREEQGPVELPVRLPPGEFAVVLVATLTDGERGPGELRLTQRRSDGELSAGFSVLLPA